MRKNKKYLFIDWGFALSDFKIYDDYGSFNLITSRKLRDGDCTNWFNIDNVRREIDSYAKKNRIIFGSCKEFFESLESQGSSYTDNNKNEAIKLVSEKNKKRDKSNPFSREIKIIK